MHLLNVKNFAEAYSSVLDLVYNNPDYVTSPRGMPIKECLRVCVEIEDPRSNLFTCLADKKLTMPTGYTKKEIALYLSGTESAKLFAAAAPFWGKIKTPENTVNSAYGNLVFRKTDALEGITQFQWVCSKLVQDKDSRQAYMLFNRPEHQYDANADVPCTLSEAFHIRNNKLYATTTMRSNDLVSGFVHDIPSFMLFQWLVYSCLKYKYPYLELGSYSHNVYSLHLYEKDFELTEARLKAGLAPRAFPYPENCCVIQSQDIAVILARKFNLQDWEGLEHLAATYALPPPQDVLNKSWIYPENTEFYNWLLK